MGPETLAQVLRPLQNIFRNADFAQVMVGMEITDDAAVYRLSDDCALIHTMDFFTPIVDDPYTYGAIAAANALSDVYAMGGDVLMALNICAFPNNLPNDIISEILRGGAEKVVEAGGAILGGHTVDDNEPKYGLSVVGRVHPDKILMKSGARPGDTLILTKPLGVGIITTALKGDIAAASHVEAAVVSMLQLNKTASEACRETGVNACTDITGFSLLGHGLEIAEKSGVRLRFHLSRIPFHPGSKKYASDWLFPGGTCNNEAYYKDRVTSHPAVSKEIEMLLFTPETSGGLLIAVPPEDAATLSHAFERRQQPYWEVGEVVDGEGVEVLE
jgi:selenide,water dikinase